MATAFWAPKASKSEAPHETLLTILLQPAPTNTVSTSTAISTPSEPIYLHVTHTLSDGGEEEVLVREEKVAEVLGLRIRWALRPGFTMVGFVCVQKSEPIYMLILQLTCYL